MTTNFQQEVNKGAVKCSRLTDDESTDWCLADATRESLREHMKLLKDAYAEIERLTSLQINEIVIGDRRVLSNESEGTILGVTEWDNKIKEAGLTGRWCQIIIRPVNTK